MLPCPRPLLPLRVSPLLLRAFLPDLRVFPQPLLVFPPMVLPDLALLLPRVFLPHLRASLLTVPRPLPLSLLLMLVPLCLHLPLQPLPPLRAFLPTATALPKPLPPLLREFLLPLLASLLPLRAFPPLRRVFLPTAALLLFLRPPLSCLFPLLLPTLTRPPTTCLLTANTGELPAAVLLPLCLPALLLLLDRCPQSGTPATGRLLPPARPQLAPTLPSLPPLVPSLLLSTALRLTPSHRVLLKSPIARPLSKLRSSLPVLP